MANHLTRVGHFFAHSIDQTKAYDLVSLYVLLNVRGQFTSLAIWKMP